jgi:ubiquinone biosynthesis monooxygenase Coq7
MPGDISSKEYLAQTIRVNHAGEYGAKRIYEGQLSVLKHTESGKIIKHMYEQELVHLKYFEQQIISRGIRPSILNPFWHIAGFALGAITAKLGEKCAYACTVAVEEVIDEHYQQQLQYLGDAEPALTAKIAKFRDEELEHKDTAIENFAHHTPGYFLLSNAIKMGCKLAIFLAKKF